MGLYNPGEIELNDPPAFEMEQKVRLRRMIRNDGTFPGERSRTNLSQERRCGLRRWHWHLSPKLLHLCCPFSRQWLCCRVSP
uniref:NifZ n=1 Tax=Zehria sp. KO68DGA TaxID=167942 RepID=A2V892_9CHRO|nr:NifZ [Zehria sp. KO68DGA]